MTAATLQKDPGNALVALGDLARSLSCRTLVTIEAAGLALSIGFYAWAPHAVLLALPCLASSAFGLWGVTGHAIAASYGHQFKKRRRALRSFQVTVAVLGSLALFIAGFALIGWMMGVYIS